MILAYRMVRLIERHSQDLVRSFQQKLAKSDRCRSYADVPQHELAQAVGHIYLHLGEWLLGKTEEDIRQRYEMIGARRAEQRVAMSDLLWCIALVKENLWEYLRREGDQEQVAEVFGELEILQLIEQFFDRAMYFAMLGYERYASGRPAAKSAGAGR